MKKILIILFITISADIFPYSPYPFEVPYPDEEFFLYPFLNYSQTLEWKRTREGALYDGKFVQLSYGSVTTYDLMNSEEAVINQNLGNDFSFRFRYNNSEVRYLSYDANSLTTGIGYGINENFRLMCECDAGYEKAAVDLKPGILFKFQTVYAYAGLSFDDLLFDVKNLGGGKNNSIPVTLSADVRFSYSRLYFFISGNYGTGIDRSWIPNYYTEVLAHKNHIRNLYARVEYDMKDYLKIYSENYFDDFYDEKEFKDSTLEVSEYKFTAKLSENRLGAVFCINERNIIDAGAAYAQTKHDFDLHDGTALTTHYKRSYTIYYPAVLPYVTYKYKVIEPLTAEVSFMACYTLDEDEDNFYFASAGMKYLDKELIKLGLEYRFSPGASLYISAGQLINTGVFGGGNARLNVFF